MSAVEQEDFRRLETKVDKIADAVMRLVLVEERQAQTNQRLDTVEEKAESATHAAGAVDRKVDKWVNRGIGAWFVAGAIWAVFQFMFKAHS